MTPLREDEFLQQADAFHQEFAQHPNVSAEHCRIENTAGGWTALIGGRYSENGVTKGDFEFGLSYRNIGEAWLRHRTAVMYYFYADPGVVREKGGMSRMLDCYIEGVRKLGVSHVLVIGGTDYWQYPAAKHPDLYWFGFEQKNRKHSSGGGSSDF